MNESNKIIAVTFAMFMTEAIIHYNFGKEDVKKEEAGKGILPPPKALLRIGAVVLAFSVLNGIVIKSIK